MAYYKHRTEGKTAAKFKEKSDQKLEGTVILAPNVDYNLQNVYKFTGLGAVFSGNYKIKKVTKRIDLTGMMVSADVVQVSSGGGTPPPKSQKVTTKSGGKLLKGGK